MDSKYYAFITLRIKIKMIEISVYFNLYILKLIGFHSNKLVGMEIRNCERLVECVVYGHMFNLKNEILQNLCLTKEKNAAPDNVNTFNTGCYEEITMVRRW